MIKHRPVTLPPEQLTINRLIWLAIGCVIAFDAVCVIRDGFTLDVANPGDFLFILIACAIVAVFHRLVRRDDSLYLFGNAINQLILAATAGTVLSYISAAINLPFIDGKLLTIDHWLGFDWKAYASWLDAHPSIADKFNFAYQSFPLQIIVFTCLLFIYAQSMHAQRFIIVFCFSGFICAALGGFFPALGMLSSNGITAEMYPHIDVLPALSHAKALLALREHSTNILTIPGSGIVMFPSFHSALAVMLIYACLPLHRLRIVIIPLNIAMLLATPVNGGHYLIDIIAGLVIVAIGITLAERALPRRLQA